MNTLRVRSTLTIAAAACLLSACAVPRLLPGMAQDEVTARYGKPTRIVPLQAGATRLQYSRQPWGQSVVMVDLDAEGRVRQSREVMTFAEFSKIAPFTWNQADVEREFGPPAMVDRVARSPDDIWTYRWRDDELDKFFYIYLDGQGRVTRTQQGMEYREFRSQDD